MLKANVGLSRKISRDYNSTGYSVNLDGEIMASLDDPEAITEKIRELFSLAQEALNQEIDRDQGEDAIGRRDEERPAPVSNGSQDLVGGNQNGQPTQSPPQQSPKPAPSQSQTASQNGHSNGNPEAATNKQIQFLLNMGKRFKLSTSQLEGRIGEIIGRRCRVYDLTKKEAGLVLDHLTKSNNRNGTSRHGN